jgi:hypothetical protein
MEEQKQPSYTQQYNFGNNYGPPPKTWLAESIIVTILCCQIFGVIAIIYSSQVESKHRSGDFQGAISSSNTAKNWVITAAATSAVLILVFAFIAVLSAIADGGF